jgi:hypothetical protein
MIYRERAAFQERKKNAQLAEKMYPAEICQPEIARVGHVKIRITIRWIRSEFKGCFFTIMLFGREQDLDKDDEQPKI